MSSHMSTPDQALRAARRCAIINVLCGGALLTFAYLAWSTGESLYKQITIALLTTVPVMIREIRRWLRLREMSPAE
jgi:Flp pilus assembly protein TadB